MSKTLEQLAEEIYKEALEDGEEVTMDEAREMAEMEIKAKGLKNYTQSEVERKPRAHKPRKVDEEKKFLITEIENVLRQVGAVNTEIKTETEINFSIFGNAYTVKLTKHRPKKN